jgi:hypothetical protein
MRYFVNKGGEWDARERKRGWGQGKGYHFLFVWCSGQGARQPGCEDVLDDGGGGGDTPDGAHGAEEVDGGG